MSGILTPEEMTLPEMAEALMWDFMKRAAADEMRAYQQYRKFSGASERIMDSDSACYWSR